MKRRKFSGVDELLLTNVHKTNQNFNSLSDIFTLTDNKDDNKTLASTEKGVLGDTEIMLFTGVSKQVKYVSRGDVLMGADCMPQVVIDISTIAEQDIYEIIPVEHSGQDNFLVNGNYTLVLKCNISTRICERDRKNFPYMVQYLEITNNQLKRYGPSFKTRDEAENFATLKTSSDGIIWTTSVLNFLNTVASTRGDCKLFKPNLIIFPTPTLQLKVSLSQIFPLLESNQPFINLTAWCLGMWLTDGVSARQWISQGGPVYPAQSHHQEAMNEMLRWGNEIDFIIPQVLDKTSSGGNPVYYFKFPLQFRKLLRIYDLLNNKHFPHSLLTESVEIRMHLLGGIIDGDGYYDEKSKSYEVACKHLHFAQQLKFLAKSLGFRVGRIADKTVLLNKDTCETWSGHRLIISGNNLTDLAPYIRISYKRCLGVNPNKDSNCWGFKIIKRDASPTYGIKVQESTQILMKDFTVTCTS